MVTRTTPTNTQSWDFPGSLAAKTPSFNAGGPGSIHCQGARSSKHMATHSHPYTEPQPTTQSCCLVAQLCLTLCDPTGCSTPGLPVSRPLLKFAQVHVHCINDAIQPSHPLPFSSCPQSFPTSVSFPMNWLFASGDQNAGALASASASVLLMSVSGLISLKIDRFDLHALKLLSNICSCHRESHP